jgi:hypothetical protein
MRVKRDSLITLLNRLYDREDGSITIEHPATEIGELLTIELGDVGEVTIRFTKAIEEYIGDRQDVGRQYPERVYDDLPEADAYLKAILASGIIDIANREAVETFLDRYGDPDLMAGHPPVFAGFDTNLMPWRIDRLLGLRDSDSGVGYVNGFVLATGVRDELDWDYKCHNTDPFVDAFGETYEAYWNQPLGSARIGRLGLLTYRTIRDIQQADEIQSDTGDEAIIDAYDAYNQERRSDILIFSNDRTFVERARSHRLLGHRVEFPDTLPDQTTATWREVEQLIYLLAIVFGMIELPSVTVYGVWRGKDELDWQHERVRLDARSPPLEAHLEADLSIVESYEELTGE